MTVYLHYVSAEWTIPSNADKNSNFVTYQKNFLKVDFPENWIFTETTDSVTFAPDRNSIDKIKLNVLHLTSGSIPIKAIVDSHWMNLLGHLRILN